jgi:hypothetical protein
MFLFSASVQENIHDWCIQNVGRTTNCQQRRADLLNAAINVRTGPFNEPMRAVRTQDGPVQMQRSTLLIRWVKQDGIASRQGMHAPVKQRHGPIVFVLAGFHALPENNGDELR